MARPGNTHGCTGWTALDCSAIEVPGRSGYQRQSHGRKATERGNHLEAIGSFPKVEWLPSSNLYHPVHPVHPCELFRLRKLGTREATVTVQTCRESVIGSAAWQSCTGCVGSRKGVRVHNESATAQAPRNDSLLRSEQLRAIRMDAQDGRDVTGWMTGTGRPFSRECARDRRDCHGASASQ